MRDLEDEEAIERAMQYLVHSFESAGENPKPVILHSTRVGMTLYDGAYETRIVIAGFLHDLLEDTDVTSDEIRSRFGKDIAKIVEATSVDENIDDYLARHYEMYQRCFELGRTAVAVKAADIVDNSEYYHMGDTQELKEKQLEKMGYFIESAEPYIGEEDIHQELTDKFPIVKERVKRSIES